MTSLSPSRTEQPSLEGRSVRDIVQNSPALVNEVWCRKIFRQILQSLELQYAMQMPHRAITPDTIVFQENGEPLLVPALIGEPAHTEAEDLHALAAIIHYAITHEAVPAGPLRGRAPEGYSESLLTAVDRSLAPDQAQRPRSIEALRDILGIVSLGPPVGARLAHARMGTAPRPASPPGPPPEAHGKAAPRVDLGPAAFRHAAADQGPFAGLGRWQRWALAVGGGAVLAALALTMFAELRDSGSYDHIVLSLPQTREPPHDGHADDKGALTAGAQASAPAQDPSTAGAGDGGAMIAGSQDGAPTANPAQAARDNVVPLRTPAGVADTAPAEVRAVPAVTARTRAGTQTPPPALASARSLPATRPVPNGVANPGASYRLRILPWGVVYVDGIDRGVSPPVKRLGLAPGRHTLRVTNPAFQDRVLEVDTGGGDGQIAVDFNDQAN